MSNDDDDGETGEMPPERAAGSQSEQPSADHGAPPAAAHVPGTGAEQSLETAASVAGVSVAGNPRTRLADVVDGE